MRFLEKSIKGINIQTLHFSRSVFCIMDRIMLSVCLVAVYMKVNVCEQRNSTIIT